MFSMEGWTDEAKAAFNEADKKVHKVEDEWHYPIMIKYGWVAETKEGIGFVRSYKYKHPVLNKEMKVVIGVNGDYWEGCGGFGYWAELEDFLKKLNV